MQASNTLYVRFVPQAHNRGFMLLASFESTVTHKTAIQYTSYTKNELSAERIAEKFALLQKTHNAADVADCTALSVYKKLYKVDIVDTVSY